MAARNRKGLSENTRQRIQTTMIVKRLEKHILAEPKKNEDGEMVIDGLMTQSQVSAALGLIKKTLPDLASMELTGEVKVTNERELSDAELDQRIIESRARISELMGRAKEEKGSEENIH